MQGHSRHLRVGLPLKSVLILTFVVLGAMTCGGWFYCDIVRDCLHAEDHRRAMRIGQALALAAQHDLSARRHGALLGRYYFERRFGKKRWRQYVPILMAGYGCGMGLVSMLAIALALISKSVAPGPY